MPSTLIIAYGNPLRSDDGLGWHAAERLRSALNSEVRILTAHQLTPDLTSPLSEVELAIFIDAAQEGTPGELRCSPVVAGVSDLRFSHELSAAALLGMAQQLYGASPRAFIVSLGGESFALGERLSATVAAKVPELESCVLSLLSVSCGGKTKSKSALLYVPNAT